MEEIARAELRGVGDATAGEWVEHGEIALHLRRRLTEKEMRVAGIESVVDVRGTDEHARRVERMRPFLPPVFTDLSIEEYP